MTEITVVTSAAISDVISQVTNQINVSTIVEILTYAAPLAIGMVFAWWAIRKIARIIMAAFKKGRISL